MPTTRPLATLPMIRALAQVDHEGRERVSPVTVARELGEDLGLMAYRFRKLRREGYLDLAGTGRKRGAIIHYYRLTPAGRSALVEARGLALKILDATNHHQEDTP